MKKFIPLFISVVLAGCVAQVKTYKKPNQNFENYKTWCWLKGCDIVYQGPEHYYDQKMMEAITNAIAQNMYEKGYVQSDDSSDLALNYFIVLEEDSTSISDEYDDIISATFYPQYEKFLRGSLVIDVIDRQKSELIWRSSAERYMEINPTFDSELINRAVSKSMRKLPAQRQP